MSLRLFASLSLALLLAGCDVGSGDVSVKPSGTPPSFESGDPTGPESTPERPSSTCDTGRAYIGFGKEDVVSDRVDQHAGVDRARTKPFSALLTEFPRVLGNRPAQLAGMAATFGEPAARWYEEPQASAVSLFSAYRVAFEGCLSLTAAAKYAAAPTAATAASECQGFFERFASEPAPPQAELDACVKTALVDTAAQTNAPRRWAYACAAVLTSAGFLTY